MKYSLPIFVEEHLMYENHIIRYIMENNNQEETENNDKKHVEEDENGDPRPLARHPRAEKKHVEEDEKLVVGLLALFLGGLGLHKFYLRRTEQGFLFLVFSWTLIPSIIGFIEGILVLTKNKQLV